MDGYSLIARAAELESVGRFTRRTSGLSVTDFVKATIGRTPVTSKYLSLVNANRKEGQKRQLKTGPPTIMEGDQFG